MSIKTFMPLAVVVSMVLCIGCASVPMQSAECDAFAKQFPPPPPGYSGIYIYRNNMTGCAVKYPVEIDGQHAGTLVYGTYLYRLVKPGLHEFRTVGTRYLGLPTNSPQSLTFRIDEGENYFFRYELRFRLWVNKNVVVPIPPDRAQRHIAKLGLAADPDNQFGAIGSDGKGSIPAIKAFDKTKVALSNANTSTQVRDGDSPRSKDVVVDDLLMSVLAGDDPHDDTTAEVEK